MQDRASSHADLWAPHTVYVLSLDFAKQEDVANSLASVPWALLVLPEAHQLRGARAHAVQHIVASSPNIRLLLETLPRIDDVPNFGLEPGRITRWSRAQVVDDEGRRLLPESRTQLEIVEYQETPGERRVRESVETIARLLGSSQAGRWPGTLLFRMLDSSAAALAEGLRRHRSRLVREEHVRGHFDQWAGADSLGSNAEEGEQEDIESDDAALVVQENRGLLLEATERCLADVESLSADSKFSKFAAIRSKIAATTEATVGPTALCILTEFRSSLFYVQAHLEETGLHCHILHGSMTFDERAASLRTFSSEGGALVATPAVMTGINLQFVDWLVLYDLPRTPLEMEQIYGRFHRLGRTKPLRVTVFRREQSPGPEESSALVRLREIVTDEGSPDEPLH